MRRVDAFVVDFDNTQTQDEKLKRVAAARRYAAQVRLDLNVNWPLWKVRLFLLTLEIKRRAQRAGEPWGSPLAGRA